MKFSKNYLNWIFTAALLSITVGCSTDTDEILPDSPKASHVQTLTVSNIDTQGIRVTTVKAHLTNTYNHAVLTEAQFQNGRFTITLNSADMDAFVGNATKFFGNDIDISAPDATFSGIEFRAYDGNVYVGTFNCRKDGNPFFFSYTDKNLTVTGSWEYHEFSWRYDLRQKAGFGYYKKQTANGKQTYFVTESDTENLEWTLNGDNSYEIVVEQ